MTKDEKETLYFYQVMDEFNEEFNADYDGSYKMAIGIIKGRAKAKQEMVAKMLNEKAPLDFIAKVSDMSIAELKRLKKELSCT